MKIVFRRLRKKDLYVIHTYYLLLLCIFFLYYFLSGTRQSAKNSFHIMPDNKHTHTHKFSQWAFSCAAMYLYSLAFVCTSCNKLIRKPEEYIALYIKNSSSGKGILFEYLLIYLLLNHDSSTQSLIIGVL